MSSVSHQALLIELLTEELPPKALPHLSQSFSQSIADALYSLGLRTQDAPIVRFASPRRLAVLLENVAAKAPNAWKEEKIMPVNVALDADGHPTPALLKKIAARGWDESVVSQFERRMDGKSASLFYRFEAEGVALKDVLTQVLQQMVKKLPVPKVMRWGDLEVQFVRPVHSLICLHGDQVIDAEILGLTSGRETLGHRFLSSGKLSISEASAYPRILHDEGRVFASFEARRELIRMKLNDAAEKWNAQIAAEDALLDEVTALVEWPVILEAEFEAEFLQVPQECLILTMQQNQKYFPLLDQNGKLMNHFLLVANLASAAPHAIVAGNERVLRARLSDARFFFEQDAKTSLEARLPKLEQVVYHNQLGSQRERVARIEQLALIIAKKIGANETHVTRAARLAKADLVSDMVGEFPELQGIMGQYYARLDGEADEVAQAIEAHYRPRFAGDELPQGEVAICVALADKLESLAGVWGIGLIPTGDKDPFALRRQALGVLRILLETRLKLDLRELFEAAVSVFQPGQLASDTVNGLQTFALDRLRHYLSQEARADEVDAVLAIHPTEIFTVSERLNALARFRHLPESSTLAAANKRVHNILRKNANDLPEHHEVDKNLLEASAEKALYAALEQFNAQHHGQNYDTILQALAQLKAPVDAFFEEVMVMAEELAIRKNRLCLLAHLSKALTQCADLSLLSE